MVAVRRTIEFILIGSRAHKLMLSKAVVYRRRQPVQTSMQLGSVDLSPSAVSAQSLT